MGAAALDSVERMEAMKIAVIQASSQRDKNPVLYRCVREAVEKKGHEVVNFGVFPGEEGAISYVETALCISLLLESGSVDFVVTGCSSGQGMMLACNSLPGVLCGYVASPSDAFLFGRINGGNAVSYPLGLNYGWAAEINLQSALDRLFEEPFGEGYPKAEAERKKKDTALMKKLNGITKRTGKEVLPQLEAECLKTVMQRECVIEYIMQNSSDAEYKTMLKKLCGREACFRKREACDAEGL